MGESVYQITKLSDLQQQAVWCKNAKGMKKEHRNAPFYGYALLTSA